MSRVLLGLTALGLVACADTVDVSRLPSIEGYASWPSYGHHGAIPGHGESYRTIFVNPVGQGCWSTCHRAAPLDGTWGRYGE